MALLHGIVAWHCRHGIVGMTRHQQLSRVGGWVVVSAKTLVVLVPTFMILPRVEQGTNESRTPGTSIVRRCSHFTAWPDSLFRSIEHPGTMGSNAIQCNPMQCNATQRDATQRNNQRDMTQHNTTRLTHSTRGFSSAYYYMEQRVRTAVENPPPRPDHQK